MEDLKGKEVLTFEKVKSGIHDDRQWLLCTYKHMRFMFTQEVIKGLSINVDETQFKFSKEVVIVEDAGDKGTFIKMRTPLKTIKSLISVRLLLEKGVYFSMLDDYLINGPLSYSFEKSQFGDYLLINYGDGMARNDSDSIKISAGKSIMNSKNEVSLNEYLLNNKDSVICKAFKKSKNETEIKSPKSEIDLKQSLDSKSQKKDLLNSDYYYRFYMQKIKNNIKTKKK